MTELSERQPDPTAHLLRSSAEVRRLRDAAEADRRRRAAASGEEP